MLLLAPCQMNAEELMRILLLHFQVVISSTIIKTKLFIRSLEVSSSKFPFR